ncbi:formimidoylglutamate deiminase [Nitratireductor indicus]|uniref:formimidoylglutamate deiminase n=1 Tax=Nitratireductor indicus TaxID=721133 RepID=UPI00287628A1|nr:formimidoylglutamate deiminase [Nitratireductor indicus]MDS1137648.1 formimidoylglutamate deiminase [Nitratireductor indicus]
MTVIHAENALLPDGLAHKVRVVFSATGIESVERDAAPQPGDERHRFLLPAMANLHSHALQHAMAGLAERRGPGADSFWSWRTEMYRIALSMAPDQVEAVAAHLYMEMLEAGFCRVGEFHYLHHDRDGSPYADPAEMAERIGAASAQTGIALTLLPVFYAHSGFGGAEPADGQRRFIHTVDAFETLMGRARTIVAALPGGVLGVAPHSLRAVTAQELGEVLPLAQGGPIHIHVAEQVKEVEDCVEWSGLRPVEWLFENAAPDARWCLIHATHMTDAETTRMARSGAIAGLCPITEANLGDGVFPAPAFLEAGGAFGVGSDSNILISLTEELRTLEYSQRLLRRARNVVAEPGQSTGTNLFQRATTGGAQALGSVSGIAVGHPADLITLDLTSVDYLPGERVLDHFIFAKGIGVDSVWVSGSKKVEGGRHRNRSVIVEQFSRAMKALAG